MKFINQIILLILFLVLLSTGLYAKIILQEDGDVPRYSKPNSLYRDEITQSASYMNFTKIFNDDYVVISNTVFNLVRIVMEYSYIDKQDGKKWHNIQAQINTYSDTRIFAKVLVCDDFKKFNCEKSKGELLVTKKIETIINQSLDTGKAFKLCGTIDEN